MEHEPLTGIRLYLAPLFSIIFLAVPFAAAAEVLDYNCAVGEVEISLHIGYRDSNRPANSSRRIGDGSGAIQRRCLWSHIARRSSGGSNTAGSSIRAHHRRSNQVWRGTTGNEGCSHTQSALGNFNPSQRKKRLVLSKKHDLRDRLVEEMKVRKGSPASAEGL
jgi:hypothetical protein